MSLPSHGHRILSAIVKILLICNVIKKCTKFPNIINLPFVFILIVIFITVAKSIFSVMVLFGDGGMPTMFRYKVSVLSGDQQENLKWGTPIEIPNLSLPLAAYLPTPFRIYLLNTNRIQCTWFDYFLFLWPLWKITQCGSENLNWGFWCLVWSLIIIFGRSSDLCNHMDIYFIINWFQMTLYNYIKIATSLKKLFWPNFRLRELVYPWYSLHAFYFLHKPWYFLFLIFLAANCFRSSKKVGPIISRSLYKNSQVANN